VEQQPERLEPTLEDLDISIPQVDCRFLADLVRCRQKRKEVYNNSRGEALAKVEQFMAGSGAEASAAEEQRAIAQLTEEEKALVTHFRPDYDDGFVLIDTRTVPELAAWGAIEGSKVLPAHEMWDAFHMTPENFEDVYGFAKPRPDQTIIFICQFGARSLMAAQILTWMGYPKVMHFRDGFFEWSKQFHKLVRMMMEHDTASGNDLRRRASFEAARQLQRAVAPEFNALPIQEASAYVLDGSRSPGTKLVGEGLREEAQRQLSEQVTLFLGDSPSTGPMKPDKNSFSSGIDGFLKTEGGGGVGKNIGPESMHTVMDTVVGSNPPY
jgi:rhodanese-related sulfurtransferase